MSKYTDLAMERRSRMTPEGRPAWNCCQAVVSVFAEDAGYDEAAGMKAATCFRGGMQMGSVCGAVTGGLMALGLAGVDDAQAVNDFIRKVRDRHEGLVNCADLLRVNAENGGEKMPHCNAIIRECIGYAEEILRAKGKLPAENPEDRNTFRPMRRITQQISNEECVRILREEKRGVLSVHGEGGYPYGVPMNHWYCPEDGKLYFHGARAGHKIDALMKNSRVSYCVHDAGYRKEGEWALNISSVVVFGRIRPVTDEAKQREIGRSLCLKFTDDEAYIRRELRDALSRTLFLELTIDHMTGKLVNEA